MKSRIKLILLTFCLMAPLGHNNFCEGRKSCGSSSPRHHSRPDLIFAARENDLDGVKEALAEPDVDINITDSNQSTALVYAVENNNSEMVKYLLDHGANANKGSPLFMAETVEIAQLLIDHGADVNTPLESPFGKITPLSIAIISRNVDIAEFFLDHDANPNIKINDPLCNQTPLHFAVHIESERLVKALLDHGADAHITYKDEETKEKISGGCCCACYCEDSDEEQGPEAPQTPLQYALYKKQQVTKILHLFKQYDLQKRMSAPTVHLPKRPIQEPHYSENDECPEATRKLYAAIDSGDLDRIKEAVVLPGADLHNRKMRPLLDIAIRVGNKMPDGGKAIIQCLLEHGIAPDDFPPSPLCYVYRPAIAQLLIDHGACVNQLVSCVGPTLLGELLDKRRYSVAKVVIRNGADVNIIMQNHLTPLHLATWKKRIRLVELLLQHGADGKVAPQPKESNEGCGCCCCCGCQTEAPKQHQNRGGKLKELKEKMIKEMAAKTPYQIAKEENDALERIIKIFNDHGIYE